MPYITEDKKPLVLKTMPRTSGELNYTLTFFVQKFLGNSPNYDKYNSAIGALEACKLEMYRRAVAPYEDKKMEENGDVW